jgi:hypothetical protein
VTLPIDISKPESRPFRLAVFTDEDTGEWVTDLARQGGIEPSLVCHRILRSARENAARQDGERRTTDRRAS